MLLNLQPNVTRLTVFQEFTFALTEIDDRLLYLVFIVSKACLIITKLKTNLN